MVGYGIRCPHCDGVFSTIEETRGAPERRLPVIARVRRCKDCGGKLVTLELLMSGTGGQRVLLPGGPEVLRAVRSARHALARGAMVSGIEMAGE